MAKKKTASKKSAKSPKMTPEIKGCMIYVAAVFLFLSLFSYAKEHDANHLLGLAGFTVGLLFHALLGLSSYIFCGYLVWLGSRFILNRLFDDIIPKTAYTLLFLLSTSILLSVIEEHWLQGREWIEATFYPALQSKNIHYHLGGAPFFFFYHDLPYLNLQGILNWIGVACLFSFTWTISFLYFTKSYFLRFFFYLKSKKLNLPKIPKETVLSKMVSVQTEPEGDFLRYVKLRSSEATPNDVLAIQPETVLKKRPSLSDKEEKDHFSDEKPERPIPLKKNIAVSTAEKALLKPPLENFNDFKLPNPALLTNSKKVDTTSLKKDLRRQAEVLEETLVSFGIEAKVGQINCGPTINSFEVHPSIGVKVQKIKALENDIALNMEAKSIRIIAPIPGKAAVGIEVPNPYPQEVGFKEMLMTYKQNPNKFRIPILLGKAVNGDCVMSDLTKWPHCIIAGATGSGKSVCINTIVMSIVMNAKPDEIKLVMVDPKKVELTPYTALPHMLAPVITEPKDACIAMNWLVKEMEKRYEILKQLGARNIESFNTRTPNQEFEAALKIEVPERMPYIVGIVDELADLMMVSSSDIETPIARIAQMARAVGIHLILATQRPSREVITGLIKANFPTRISFKVASRINSQIVLDEVGAESLLGNGDMLFLPPGSSHLTRAQGAYIRDEDIQSVVKFLSEQSGPNYLINSFSQLNLTDELDDAEEPGDSLYKDALDIILSTGNASTTFLQRKLKIGYARAASLIDQLELRGIVSPAEGSKPRKILASRNDLGSKNDDVEV